MALDNPDSGRWGKLRAWIKKNEEFEREHGRSMPMDENQAAALQLLMAHVELRGERPMSPPGATRLPPSGRATGLPLIEDGVNYINQLSESRQSSHASLPVYTDQPVFEANGVLSWSCICNVESVGRFPNPKFGFRDGKAPSFPKKKDAKQYAAKCAVEYLSSKAARSPHRTVSMGSDLSRAPPVTQNQKRMSSPTAAEQSRAKTPKPSPEKHALPTPTQFPVQLEFMSSSTASLSDSVLAPESTTSSPTTPVQHAVPNSPQLHDNGNAPTGPTHAPPSAHRPNSTNTFPRGKSKGPRPSSTPTLDFDDYNAVQDVRRLCERLGIQEPRYTTAPLEGAPGYYEGRVHFNSETPAVAAVLATIGSDPSWSVVQNVLTKKAAKEQLAKQVSKELSKVLSKREEEAFAL